MAGSTKTICETESDVTVASLHSTPIGSSCEDDISLRSELAVRNEPENCVLNRSRSPPCGHRKENVKEGSGSDEQITVEPTGNKEENIILQIKQRLMVSCDTKQKIKSKLAETRTSLPSQSNSGTTPQLLERRNMNKTNGNTADAFLDEIEKTAKSFEDNFRKFDNNFHKPQQKFVADDVLVRPPLHFSTPAKSTCYEAELLRKPNDGETRSLSPNRVETSSSRTKRHRVSFSDLPPVEFPVSREEIDLLGCSEEIFPLEKSTTDSSMQSPGDKDALSEEDPEENTTFSQPPEENSSLNGEQTTLLNEGDRANECLVDILEEIEAENILLSHCLVSWVEAGLLSHEAARYVSVDYKSKQPQFEPLEGEIKAKCIKKLVDVLMDLNLEKLSKCRNLVLNKLCQLSSREEYEIAQKAAANKKDHVKNGCQGNSSRTGFELPEDMKVDVKESIVTSAEAVHVIHLASKLVDVGVVSARQMWEVLCAGGERIQRHRLRKRLNRLPKSRLDELYEIQGLERLKWIMEEDGDVESNFTQSYRALENQLTPFSNKQTMSSNKGLLDIHPVMSSRTENNAIINQSKHLCL